ncbi:hypothetical protein ACE8FZ_24665 [Peribacillus frigoritolerans]|uniref:hypothetical protein n=1 Tax=Peribacillus frigoritolerans TaxID=450367 RepID=UPI0035D137B4
MSEEMSYEERFKHTLLEYLSIEGETELQQMLSQSELVEKPQWDFTSVSGQRGMKIEIKVPNSYVKIIEEKYKPTLYKICKKIYKNDSDYGFTGIEIGVVLLSTIKTVNHLTKEVSYLQNHANYQYLMNKVSNMDIEDDQKLYIYEACNSAISGNNIAAMVTLGCATELLFINTCNAYKNYLLTIGEQAKAERFTNKVVNAKVAFTRVNEFYKLVESDESMQIFSQYGLENIRIQFNFLDIIRQVRNDSGHPTGKKVSNEDLSTMFGNFQLLIERLDKFNKDYSEEPLPF